jgi:hypothetical protein
MLITTRLTTMIINHTQMAAVHQSSKENDQNFTEFRWSLVQCAHLEKYEFVQHHEQFLGCSAMKPKLRTFHA